MITEIKIGVGKFISISNETTSDLNYILWNNGWMKNIYCIKCSKYNRFKNPKIWYIFNETSDLFIVCDKCGSKNDTIFEKKNILQY